MLSHEGGNPIGCAVHLVQNITNSYHNRSSNEPPDITKDRIRLQMAYLILDLTDDDSRVSLDEDPVCTKLLFNTNKACIGSSKLD